MGVHKSGFGLSGKGGIRVQETRQQIMDAVIDQFNKKGLKFDFPDCNMRAFNSL